MAGRRQQQAMKHAAHRLFASPAAIAASGTDADEFDESDVWGCPVEPRRAELSKLVPSPAWKKSDPEGGDRTAASSLPVEIPDWPKILGNCTRSSHSSTRGWWEEQADDDDEGSAAAGQVVPPHELLRRGLVASFSVHEGVGRTLKGRDLSRVRDAIWEKTGFQD
ncbi:protein S40-4-like [Musa acuminata AAA Group]|uniref:(wild Malaysian banana) hypothetical protein n=1 Tax=Musa acuminata subsp. malaccensis TaxID=214687 RepID=A0A804HXQ0_MUSAM|nr:PREDICTED: uncharacterized protein LOC103974208 [Musa acuminata subsp. malaccensis]CAG1860764.1 unnamed protein product [Musa acuminata subsp. malaccensis]